MREEFYVWREKVTQGGETRLLIPHSDPFQHEQPMDLLFDTPSQAYQALRDYGIVDMYYDGDEEPAGDWRPDDWYLCRVTTEVVE